MNSSWWGCCWLKIYPWVTITSTTSRSEFMIWMCLNIVRKICLQFFDQTTVYLYIYICIHQSYKDDQAASLGVNRHDIPIVHGYKSHFKHLPINGWSPFPENFHPRPWHLGTQEPLALSPQMAPRAAAQMSLGARCHKLRFLDVYYVYNRGMIHNIIHYYYRPSTV
jgi:hypothetical protein